MGNELLVSVGEPSGDRIGASVVAALVGSQNSPSVFGIGGEELKAAGVCLTSHIKNLSAMGIRDSALQLGAYLEAYATLRAQAMIRKPAAALLVDAPELNLRLAAALRRQGIKVMLFIPPKVFAWRRGRLATIARNVDHVALAFPFETPIYERAGIPATFVGHPVVDSPLPVLSAGQVRSRLHCPPGGNLAVLLPGSRAGELARHLPVMCSLGTRLMRQGVRVVAAPPVGSLSLAQRDLLANSGVTLWAAGLHDLLCAADVAVAVSGTITLDLLWCNTPMVVIYRMDNWSYGLARRLVRVPYIALPNWLAGQKLVSEYVQDEVTLEALEDGVFQLLDPVNNQRMRSRLERVRSGLGKPEVGSRVGRIIGPWLGQPGEF